MSYFHYQSKQIFYKETGRGKPLIMLHGDTASSAMFEFILPLYQENFRVILLDFLGNGQSDRVDRFPENLWITQAEQVIADSFDGRTLAEDFKENLLKERETAKQNIHARQFYEWCQGEDWEKVVDLNTRALVKCAVNRNPLFCRPLESLCIPVLFMGSLEDDMCRKNLLEEYAEMEQLVQNGRIHVFKTGGHPSVVMNGEASAKVITEFIGI